MGELSANARVESSVPSFLLIGPYDPYCGEYTFLAPPLGVWRLSGVLESGGTRCKVFDPNCCEGHPTTALERILRQDRWDVVGVSTTGMTLPYDLELSYVARRICPESLIIAGGMEATFKPELVLDLGPFDLVVLGEGERPLLELAHRIQSGRGSENLAGTARRGPDGGIQRIPQQALNKKEMWDAIQKTPYERMPHGAYWERLERAYRVNKLPVKADREARLAEVRSVRLITLNYCPMGCTFCSSTNFLNAAQGEVSGIVRLDTDECLTMIKRIVAAQPEVRTIIFQDDIFVFTQDRRILPLCESIIKLKAKGELPADLQFISTNRIDAMDSARLAAMRRAGFRVLGFGVESFSLAVLHEFNKSRIFSHIEPVLGEALWLGITPFLDLILTSPRSSLHDSAETIRRAYTWLLRGCEIGMYPYVIPFSGAAMANDASLLPYTSYTTQRIAGTDVEWQQPTKILPVDPTVRKLILAAEEEFQAWLSFLEPYGAHLPSRVRSLIWVICACPALNMAGQDAPKRAEVLEQLLLRLPGLDATGRESLRSFEEAGRSKEVEFA